MDFSSTLAGFRQQYSQNRAKYKQEVTQTEEAVEPTQPEAMWADEIEMPVAGAPAMDTFTGAEVEVPNLLTDNDDRLTGDEEVDKQAFMELLQTDPTLQQYGPEIEALIEEIMDQMSDPENPMTAEEAQRTFVQMMNEEFGQHFQ